MLKEVGRFDWYAITHICSDDDFLQTHSEVGAKVV